MININSELFREIFREMTNSDGSISDIQMLTCLIEEIATLRAENTTLKELLIPSIYMPLNSQEDKSELP